MGRESPGDQRAGRHRRAGAARRTRYCADPDVLGAPFYVMERVRGHAVPHRGRARAARPRAHRARIARAMVDTLAALHAVDPAAVGLGRLRPARGLPRAAGAPLGQAARRLAQPRPARRRRAARAALAAQRARQPARPAIVHGDYRLDNLLVDDATTGGHGRRSTGRWPRSATRSPTSALLLVYDRLGRDLPAAPSSDAAPAPGYPDADELARALRRRQRPRRLGDLRLAPRRSPTSSSR